MKKIIGLLSLIIGVLLLSGCKNDSMENITIYTSYYPIQYVTKELYGEHAQILNMYPQGIEPYNYKLTSKQIKDYGSSDLIIYNGLGKEKDYIVTMINNNKNLKIIDATNRIEFKYSQNELWINPSNVLMIAQNVKDGLKEYINSSLLSSDIDKKYEALKIDISSLDVELKEMGENASNKNILVQDNELTFLSKYSLNVISLDDNTITDKIYSDTTKLIDEGDIKYIYTFIGEEDNKTVTKLKEAYPDLKTIYLDPLNNITSVDKNNNKNYITIMNENIDKLKQELY